jgi:voltage-gated potassium channel
VIMICGYGPSGRSCAESLERETSNIVIIDKDPEKLKDVSHPYVVGDATKEDVLLKAGIESAKVVIASADSDVANAFITLAAKSLNPSVKVYTIAERLESVDKLYRAGADYVVPQSSIGARELVNGALKYTKESSKIYLGSGVELHAIISSRSGKTEEMARISGAKVVAVRRGDKLMGTHEYRKGDRLYVLGNERQIEILRKAMGEGL